MSATFLDLVCSLGETNNGIKKESVAKDTVKIWGNEGIKAPNFSHSLVHKTLLKCQLYVGSVEIPRILNGIVVIHLQKPPGIKEEDEVEEEEEEELGHAETYAEYMPMKCKI